MMRWFARYLVGMFSSLLLLHSQHQLSSNQQWSDYPCRSAVNQRHGVRVLMSVVVSMLRETCAT